MTDFSTFGLIDAVSRAITEAGYEKPTPIQQQAIPLVLEGRDVLGIAQTGTGKTLAFAAPTLDRMKRDQKATPRKGCRVLVLAPTRELASQIADSFSTYNRFLGFTIFTVFGGVKINKQIQRMNQGVDVLVATPGRMLDLIQQGAMSLRHVETLVLDEADQMLDLGFIHSLKKIIPMLPKERQTLFFSATMPSSISELAGKYLTNPAKVSVAPPASTAERVDQTVTFAEKSQKPALLVHWLRRKDVETALVFSRTKHGADKIVRQLGANGVEAVAIHGNKSQPQRERALEAFKSGAVKVMVATDIAARGIDISGLSHVFNYDLPNVPDQYVHRIGRTGRAGAEGVAISFCDREERAFLRDIEKTTRLKVPVAPLPEGLEDVAAAPAKQSRQEPSRGRSSGRSDGRSGAGNGRAPQGRNGAGKSGPSRNRSDGPRSPQAADGSRKDKRSGNAGTGAKTRPQAAGGGLSAIERLASRQDGEGGQRRPRRNGPRRKSRSSMENA